MLKRRLLSFRQELTHLEREEVEVADYKGLVKCPKCGELMKTVSMQCLIFYQCKDCNTGAAVYDETNKYQYEIKIVKKES